MGRILAAEYDNSGHPYQAVLFHDATGAPGYFRPDGGALQKAFSALSLEIRRAGNFTFQPVAFSSYI